MKILEIDQNTEQWDDERRGRITGSKFKDIIIKRGNTKKAGFWQLIADKVSVKEEGEPESPMDRGHRLEQEALDVFEKETKIKAERVGFCISDKNEGIALSPDGFTKVKGKYTIGEEVKCLGSAIHLEVYFTQKIPKVYEEQKIQYFVVNKDLKELYFIFYDPRVSVLPMHYIKVERKDIEKEIEAQEKYQIDTLKEVDELVTELTF